MKLFKYFSILAIALLYACSSDDENITPVNETDNLHLVQEISNDNHSILLYTKSGNLVQGYNQIYFQIKDGENFIKNAEISWQPIMHMTEMMHSCPASTITKSDQKETLYKAFSVFQMAGNATEYWELNFEYTVNGQTYTASDDVSVIASEKKRVNVFTGSDEKRYVLALVEPQEPQVATNNMQAGLFVMENMMQFSPVDNYSIQIDPRMPSMGNHSSPNNQDLQQVTSGGFYEGKLSLTMTGYWIINLQVLDDANQLIKGEPITATNEASSIYFEIEF